MKADKPTVSKKEKSLVLDDCFGVLEAELTRAIDAIDGIKPLKAARKELKAYRLAIAAIQRQVNLYEKNPRG